MNLKYYKFKITQKNNDICAICFETINQINNITITNCNHKYHSSCIFKWVNQKCKNYNLCPMCRQILFSINTPISTKE